jgi:ATP-binding cassette subfamily C protein CydC
VGIALVAPSATLAILALGALAVGEVVVPLAGAAARQAELGGAVARITPLLGGSGGILSALNSALDRPGSALNSAFNRPGPGDSALDRPGPGDPALRVPAPRAGALGGPASGEGAVSGPGPGGGGSSSAFSVPDVRLERVTVRYSADGPAVLDDVSLTVTAGARIAVIGSSGAGKSTLLAVIAGTVVPQRGVVHGAGTGWPLVGGVFADAHVFHATVRDNVALGREGVTDGDVSGALADAGLELGLDVMVGEDGAQVSGGQRQRLLLARALVRLPAVLLLDEPTEGLDATTADAVLDSALAAAGASTVVVVTHRYANLHRFGEIVRLEEGRRVAPDVADVGR